jgi:GT2 family glycosyltransferase
VPRCSIVIPVHNRASLTRQCLETLLGDSEVRQDAEIVVVDDGSADETTSLLDGFGEITVLRHESATGFATACNDGAAAGRTALIVFLNNDTIPTPGWLGALLGYADAHPEAAAIGAKLLFPNDTIQHAGMTIGEDRNPRHIYAGFPSDHPAVNTSRRVPAVTAACALFRRGPFEEAAGFDDAFRNGFEDVDLCLRLAETGHEIHYCHESVAYHLEMGTRDFGDERPNLELYRRRWADKVEPDATARYLEDGLMQIEYHVRYPFTLRVSPLLALVEEEGRVRELERVLGERADEAALLLRENVQLRVLAAEAGLEVPSVSLSPPKADRPTAPRAALFISGVYGDEMRYRCDHPVEELALLGATADARWIHELPLDDVAEAYGCFVLHHVPADEHVTAFVKAAHSRAKSVVYDADELVFDSEGDEESRRQAETLAAADAVFAATEPLAERARLLNDKVYVVPSVASHQLVWFSGKATSARSARPDDRVRLLYVCSSTRYGGDFVEVLDVLLWALAENGNVSLRLVGAPAHDSRFERFSDRIERLPSQPWRRVPAILAEADIVLAPRERQSAAAEARPCREWIEAALVGVPTVASAAPDFVRAIDPGVTGLLANGGEDWRSALGELIESPERRKALGSAALETARRDHTTATQAQTLYDTLARATGATAAERKLTINFLLGAGGSRDLSRLAGQLGWRGHRVRLFGESVPRDVLPSVELLPPSTQPLPPADATVATDAETARVATEAPRSMFTFLLDDENLDASNDLPIRRLTVGSNTDAAALERRLLELCFARLDAAWESNGNGD